MTPNINRILALPSQCRDSRRGAPMGDSDIADDLSEPLYLQRIRFQDGSYGTDGTYWGAPETMWCAFTVNLFHTHTPVRIYVRANNRDLAIMAIEEQYPTVKFRINTLRVTGRYVGAK